MALTRITGWTAKKTALPASASSLHGRRVDRLRLSGISALSYILPIEQIPYVSRPSAQCLGNQNGLHVAAPDQHRARQSVFHHDRSGPSKARQASQPRPQRTAY